MELFKGYIKTKDKKAIEKFKGISDLRTYNEVRSLSEFAGILAENTVLIDIDDSAQAEILAQIVEDQQLDCKIVATTRGKHFFFKNNGAFDNCKTHCKLACGLTADIKCGVKDCYAICKFGGKERHVEWDTDGQNYQECPQWLQPVNSNVDFINMKEGDGRDNALFSYILNLQTAGISKENAIKSIELINKYLLKDKMSDADIKRITRDEAFNAPIFFEKQKFLFDKFALYLQSEHHIKRIDGQLHMYKDGVYVSGLIKIEHEMLKHIPTLNRARRKEVLDYLDALIQDETPPCDAKWIAFKNGLLNIQDGTLTPFTADVVLTNIIPYDYNPKAYDDLMDKTLDKLACNDKSIRALLEEMAGYCLYRRNELGKAFILTGEGSNGKSTYLNCIKDMLGKQNYSVLDLAKLDDRFSTCMMYRKLANIGDDIADGYIGDSSNFKKIVTGESIKAEQKGIPAFMFDPYCKLIFSANNIPRIGRGRDSTAIMRRLVIIPFNAKFSKNDADFVPFISDKLKESTSIEYLIALGIKGLQRVLLNCAFTESEKVQTELKEFEESNNPVIGFFRDTSIDEIRNQATKDVYTKYNGYCIANGLNALGKNEFSKQVKKYYNVNTATKRLNGVVSRVFV